MMLMNRHLLADLLEGRCDLASLAEAARDDRVAAALATFGWPEGGQEACDLVAAELYELFGRSVFPFEGVFLDLEVSAQGPLGEALRAPVRPASLRRWLPAFCCSLRDLRRPLALALADVVEELLPEAGSLAESSALLVGEAPDLEHPGTDLGELVSWLATPSRCGIFLSSGALERLARVVGVPRGFGPRRRLLRQLIESAARFGQLTAVLGGLGLLVRAHLDALSGPRYQSPAMVAATAPWRERLTTTERLLEVIAGRAAAVVTEEARA